MLQQTKCSKLTSPFEQYYVLVRYFYYQIANVLLTVLSGSLFNALDSILSDPFGTPSILAQAFPNMSQYFLSYVLVNIFMGLPIALLRIGPLIIKTLLPRIFDERKKPQRELELQAESLDYGVEFPKDFFVLMVALIYSCISPIITPACFLYFAGNYFVKKYQLLYICKPA
jgi:hypothetical protein